MDSVSEEIGIGKSIGFGIGKNWFRKKVSDSVSVRFWVSSHTGFDTSGSMVQRLVPEILSQCAFCDGAVAAVAVAGIGDSRSLIF